MAQHATFADAGVRGRVWKVSRKRVIFTQARQHLALTGGHKRSCSMATAAEVCAKGWVGQLLAISLRYNVHSRRQLASEASNSINPTEAASQLYSEPQEPGPEDCCQVARGESLLVFSFKPRCTMFLSSERLHTVCLGHVPGCSARLPSAAGCAEGTPTSCKTA